MGNDIWIDAGPDPIEIEVLTPDAQVDLGGQPAAVVSFTAGPPGPAGPEGPPGPAGQDGGSSSVFQYRWHTSTAPPPANGQTRADPAAGKLWVSRLTDPDVDVTPYLGAVLVGDKIYVQDKDDSSRAATWRVTGNPVAQPSFYEFPVLLEESAGAFTNNMVIAVGLIRQGPAGPPGAKGDKGDPGAAAQAIVWGDGPPSGQTAPPDSLYIDKSNPDALKLYRMT